MKIIVLSERKPYSYNDLLVYFNKERKDFIEIIKSLSLMNIVNRIRRSKDYIDIDDLLNVHQIENIDDYPLGESYSFAFVGIIVIEDLCLIIYPKYFDSYIKDMTNHYKKFKQILSVIRKYQAKEQNIGYLKSEQDMNFNLLSLALDLIDNYHLHGLYSSEYSLVEINGHGEILWNKTINESIPYISDNVPIYLDLFTIQQYNNTNDYFRLLHAFVLTDICTTLEPVLKIIGIETINISNSEINDFGSVEYILYRINQELTGQFVTYKQNILRRIKKYLEYISSYDNTESISLIGTTSFHSIWEEVCSVVYENNYNSTLGSLNLSYKDYPKDALLSSVIDKPMWKHKQSGVVHKTPYSLIPDIVTLNEKQFSIYDAKYYKIKLEESGIENYPGLEDITKQYLYELAYYELISENDLTMADNAFLLPSELEITTEIGSVWLDIFSNIPGIKNKEIKIILLPCQDMYETYLNT